MELVESPVLCPGFPKPHRLCNKGFLTRALVFSVPVTDCILVSVTLSLLCCLHISHRCITRWAVLSWSLGGVTALQTLPPSPLSSQVLSPSCCYITHLLQPASRTGLEKKCFPLTVSILWGFQSTSPLCTVVLGFCLPTLTFWNCNFWEEIFTMWNCSLSPHTHVR